MFVPSARLQRAGEEAKITAFLRGMPIEVEIDFSFNSQLEQLLLGSNLLFSVIISDCDNYF